MKPKREPKTKIWQDPANVAKLIDLHGRDYTAKEIAAEFDVGVHLIDHKVASMGLKNKYSLYGRRKGAHAVAKPPSTYRQPSMPKIPAPRSQYDVF